MAHNGQQDLQYGSARRGRAPQRGPSATAANKIPLGTRTQHPQHNSMPGPSLLPASANVSGGFQQSPAFPGNSYMMMAHARGRPPQGYGIPNNYRSPGQSQVPQIQEMGYGSKSQQLARKPTSVNLNTNTYQNSTPIHSSG